MKIFLFFLEGNKNCRDGTKKTGSVGLAVTQAFFLGLMHQSLASPAPVDSGIPGFNVSILPAVAGRVFNSTFERQ